MSAARVESCLDTMSSSMPAESSLAAQRATSSPRPSKVGSGGTPAKRAPAGVDGDDESEDDGDAMDIKTLQSYNQ